MTDNWPNYDYSDDRWSTRKSTRKPTCPTCGAFLVEGKCPHEAVCERCSAVGQILVIDRHPRTHEDMPHEEPCPACKGHGFIHT